MKIKQVKTAVSALFIVAAFVIAGCAVPAAPASSTGGSGYVAQFTPPPTVPGMDVADSLATREAAETQHRATVAAAEQLANARAAETRIAEQATAVIIANATATAQTQADQYIGTRQALELQGTAQALGAMATRDSYQIAIEATQAADQLVATREAGGRLATAEAWAAVAVQSTRVAAARREAVDLFRAESWARWAPALAMALIVGVVAISWSMLQYHKQQAAAMRNPIQVVDQPGIVTLIQNRDGLAVLPRRPTPAGLIGAGSGETAVSELGRPVPLPRLDSGHVMIFGNSGAGKSNALRTVVENRAAISPGGDNSGVYIIDPHYTPGAWAPQAKIIKDASQIGAFLEWMNEELVNRIQQRHGGRLDFPALTVVVEEMPAITGANRAKRAQIRQMWKRWVYEGRKFKLFFITLTQSTRVASLGIEGEGDLLQAFNHVLYLGGPAVDAYPESAQMGRPAVLVSDHQPQPVIIPYNPTKDPENPQFDPHWGQRITGAPVVSTGDNAGGVHQPQLFAPAPRFQSMDVGGETVTAEDIETILSMRRRGESKRATETAIRGYPGGRAHEIVTAVLSQYGDPHPDHQTPPQGGSSSSGPMGHGPGQSRPGGSGDYGGAAANGHGAERWERLAVNGNPAGNGPGTVAA